MIPAGYRTPALRVIREQPQGSRQGLSVVHQSTARLLTRAGIHRGGLGAVGDWASAWSDVYQSKPTGATGKTTTAASSGGADWMGFVSGLISTAGNVATTIIGSRTPQPAPTDPAYQAWLASQGQPAAAATDPALLALFQQQQQQAAAAEARREADAARTRQYLMVGGGIGLAVLLGALLLRK